MRGAGKGKGKMRYKVKAPSQGLYRKFLALLQKRAAVFVTSEKRLVLSTGDIPSDVKQDLIEEGAIVTPDYQYDIDDPKQQEK